MKYIGLLSDTHSHLDERIFHHFEEVDEIWHAGDVGSVQVIERLEQFKLTRGVFGNIDDQEVRMRWPKEQAFECEDMRIYMTHIGGRPGNYDRSAYEGIRKHPSDLFVCGHSHILLVKQDPHLNLLWMNPGACGIHGFHKVRTLIRFKISGNRAHDLEVIELGKRG